MVSDDIFILEDVVGGVDEELKANTQGVEKADGHPSRGSVLNKIVATVHLPS